MKLYPKTNIFYNAEILQGKAKSVIKSIHRSGGKMQGGKTQRVNSIYKYDDRGNMIEHNRYEYGNGFSKHLVGKDDYRYDETGNIIERHCYNYVFDQRFQTALNNIVKFTYKYDNNQNMIEMQILMESILINKETYKYDNEGKLIERSCFESDGTFRGKTTYKYDYRGNVIEKYDDRGNIIEKFDDKGNMIEKNEHPHHDINIPSKFTYKYDDKGNEIEEQRFRSDGNLYLKWTTILENFDEKGNWLKKTLLQNDGHTVIVVREIEYY